VRAVRVKRRRRFAIGNGPLDDLHLLHAVQGKILAQASPKGRLRFKGDHPRTALGGVDCNQAHAGADVEEDFARLHRVHDLPHELLLAAVPGDAKIFRARTDVKSAAGLDGVKRGDARGPCGGR